MVVGYGGGMRGQQPKNPASEPSLHLYAFGESAQS